MQPESIMSAQWGNIIIKVSSIILVSQSSKYSVFIKIFLLMSIGHHDLRSSCPQPFPRKWQRTPCYGCKTVIFFDNVSFGKRNSRVVESSSTRASCACTRTMSSLSVDATRLRRRYKSISTGSNTWNRRRQPIRDDHVPVTKSRRLRDRKTFLDERRGRFFDH